MGENFLKVVFYMIFGTLLLLGAFRGEWVPDSTALQAVADEGYRDARITEKHTLLSDFYGCDEKDAACFLVTAKNVNGQQVNLVVCSGLWFKGTTVRHKY